MLRAGGSGSGAWSTTAECSGAGTWPLQEGTFASTVREQMRALEDRLTAQIARVQRQGDQGRDLAVSRLETKVSSIEATQPQLATQVAELTGKYKAIADEVKAQIRRTEQLDTKMWEWRHRFEEDVRKQLSEVDRGQEQVNSTFRLAATMSNDSLKRLGDRMQRLESVLDEHASMDQARALRKSIEVEARLHELERITATAASGETATQEAQDASRNVQAAIDARLDEIASKVDVAKSVSCDVQTRLETQDERSRSLRALLETNDEHIRAVRFHLQEVNSRLRDLQQHTQALRHDSRDQAGRLDVLQNRFELQQATQEQAQEDLDRMRGRAWSPEGWPSWPSTLTCEPFQQQDSASCSRAAAHGPDGAQVQSEAACAARLDAMENKFEALARALEGVRHDAEFASRVKSLLESLGQLAPKVMEQESSIHELAGKVSQLDIKVRMFAKAAASSASEEGPPVERSDLAAQRGGA